MDKRFKVRIFIRTSFTGPAIKDGQYAAIIEYEGKTEVVTREVSGSEDETTYNRLVMLAMLKALQILTKRCSVVIYTDCSFIRDMVGQNRPDAWKRQEWKKPSGKDVKNKELWQQYLEESGKHGIEIRYSKLHGFQDYSDRLDELIGGNQNV